MGENISFTVTCNYCKNENTFNADSGRLENDIELDVTESHSYGGSTVETIDLYCWKCYNGVEL